MGDMLELGEKSRDFHLRAGRHAASVCDVFIAVGEASRAAAESLRSRNFKDAFSVATSRQARDLLLNKLSLNKEDIVLVKGSRGMRMEEVLE